MQDQLIIGSLLALSSSISWGIATFLTKIGLRGIGNVIATFLSFSFGYFIMFSAISFTTPVYQIMSIDINIIIIGFSQFIAYITQYYAIKKIGVVKSATLSSSARPITAALLAMILIQEILKINHLIGTAMIISGIYIIMAKGSGFSFKIEKGEISAVLASICWGFAGVFTRKAFIEGTSIFTLYFSSFLVMLILVFLMFMLKERKEFRSLTKKSILFLALAGVGNMIGNLSLMLSLQMINVVIAYPFSNLTVFFSAILAILFLRERITYRIVTSAFLFFLGAYILIL
jgi:drug/metabolite transporter (DMT)-like permease